MLQDFRFGQALLLTVCAAGAHTRPADYAKVTLMRRHFDRHEPLALLALFVGACAVASSGIFVRFSQTGPTATGFWRGALALPFLAVWAWAEARHRRTRWYGWIGDKRILWAGVFFTGDLALWHWSLMLTSVTAATLEANLAPLFVALITWIIWRERPKPSFVAALAIAFTGVLLIMSPKFGQAGGALTGDLLGLGTAAFYGAYMVVVARLATTYGTGALMLRTTLIFTVLLAPLMIGQKILPDTPHGWVLLLGLAISAQVVGQGFIAYALARLPASFSSLTLLLQPLAAALYSAALLGERLAAVQIAGGAIVLAAILLAQRERA
jgi:drug/metabolite transporter (DMT)-like permease